MYLKEFWTLDTELMDQAVMDLNRAENPDEQNKIIRTIVRIEQNINMHLNECMGERFYIDSPHVISVLRTLTRAQEVIRQHRPDVAEHLAADMLNIQEHQQYSAHTHSRFSSR